MKIGWNLYWLVADLNMFLSGSRRWEGSSKTNTTSNLCTERWSENDWRRGHKFWIFSKWIKYCLCCYCFFIFFHKAMELHTSIIYGRSIWFLILVSSVCILSWFLAIYLLFIMISVLAFATARTAIPHSVSFFHSALLSPFYKVGFLQCSICLYRKVS